MLQLLYNQSRNQSRNRSLQSQRNLIPLSLVAVFVLCILQLSSFNNEGSSLVNSNSVVVKSDSGIVKNDTSSSAHVYSLQTNSMVDNNTEHMYTWIGNQWVPPPGVPYLFSQQIRSIYRSENTLWMGDSTARQDYQTMYQLIHDGDNNPTRDHLSKNINKGKRGPAEFHCPARRQSKDLFTDLGQVRGTDQNCHATNATTVMLNNTDVDQSWSNLNLHNKAGKFDLWNRLDCYDALMSKLKNHTELFEREYSILVVSGGVWESIRPHVCKRANETNKGIVSHALDLLDFFHAVSGPSLFVIWKTHGPMSDDQRTARMDQIDQSLVTAARGWFIEKQPPYMDLVNFYWEIQERAHGRDRIDGDLRPHWGLEARLLSIEMVSDVVRRKQEREIARWGSDSEDERHN